MTSGPSRALTVRRAHDRGRRETLPGENTRWAVARRLLHGDAVAAAERPVDTFTRGPPPKAISERRDRLFRQLKSALLVRDQALDYRPVLGTLQAMALRTDGSPDAGNSGGTGADRWSL